MLKFNVNNQIIERADSFKVVADSRNYLSAEFSFSEEWTGEIRAVFGNDGKFYDALIEDGRCMVPWEVIKLPFFTVSVFCGEESLVTANIVKVDVEKSGMENGEVPSTPTPTAWQQYIASMQEVIDRGLPYIGENGSWFLYNAEEGTYKDTGVSATGPKGEQGIQGVRGEKGDKGDKGEQGEQGPKGDTAEYNAGAGIDITDEIISVKGLTLISDITISEDAESVVWTQDDAGNPLSNYKDFLIYFSGTFTAGVTEPLSCTGRSGEFYFAYNSFNKKADKQCGFWIEIEEICKKDDMTAFKSRYSSSLLGNFNSSSIGTQGLMENNVAVRSDFSLKQSNKNLTNIGLTNRGNQGGVPTSVFAAGCRFLLFGKER